ncbi:MAG TPA: ABC transporter permease [Acidimicrobiales bacterium]
MERTLIGDAILVRRRLPRIGRRVPLGRRNLTADRRRLLASVVGIGLAVMLILLLDGMWAGIKAQTRLYTDGAGADLYVLQDGMRELLDGGVLPTGVVDEIASTPGVDWAEPVRGSYVILDLHGTKLAPYLVGTAPGAPGGAWSIAEGRAVAADDDVVLDSVLADRHDITVGDRLDVMGRTFDVVGLSSDTSGFMTSYLFVTHAATDELFAAAGTTSYVLVGAADPGTVRDRLTAAGFNTLTADEIAANAEEIASGIFGGPLRLMVTVAFAAGTLIIALTAYTAITERGREYGIVKALGGSRGRLVAVAVSQTLVLALLGLVAGGLLFLAGRELIIAARPQFDVAVTSAALLRAGVAALVMALLAAIVPARRLARLDPATAYRGS